MRSGILVTLTDLRSQPWFRPLAALLGTAWIVTLTVLYFVLGGDPIWGVAAAAWGGVGIFSWIAYATRREDEWERRLRVTGVAVTAVLVVAFALSVALR